MAVAPLAQRIAKDVVADFEADVPQFDVAVRVEKIAHSGVPGCRPRLLARVQYLAGRSPFVAQTGELPRAWRAQGGVIA